MSMSSAVKPWLWEMLDWDCGLDQGRLASLPENIVVSSFKVMSETGTLHQIKTISSGCVVAPQGEVDEAVVRAVTARRETEEQQVEYATLFADGHFEWLLAAHFIDDDGTVNDAWLAFADRNDLHQAFGSYTLNQLKVRSECPSLISHFSTFAPSKAGNPLARSRGFSSAS